jgi:hypothetical protein
MSCYIEFSFIDVSIAKSKKIADLIKNAEADFKVKKKHPVKTMVTFEEAPRFKCLEGPLNYFPNQ